MNIPEELQISVYHEGVALLLAYSPFEEVLSQISSSKREGKLIHQITSYTDQQLQEMYEINGLSVHNTSAWASFLKDLQRISHQYEAFHPIVLGAVIEIMDELNWQDKIEIRKLLTFYLHTPEEMAHLRLATSGNQHEGLLVWRDNVIEEAKGYAAYKSKLA